MGGKQGKSDRSEKKRWSDDSKSSVSFPTGSSRELSADTHSRRVLKVEKEILFQLSRYLFSSFKGDLPGIVSLVKVMATADLRTAKVFFSILGGNDADETLAEELLQGRASDMQAYLAKHMPLRYTPRLTFVRDTSMDRALKIDQMIHDLSLSPDPAADSFVDVSEEEALNKSENKRSER